MTVVHVIKVSRETIGIIPLILILSTSFRKRGQFQAGPTDFFQKKGHQVPNEWKAVLVSDRVRTILGKRNISFLSEFEPQIMHSLASRYIDYNTEQTHN